MPDTRSHSTEESHTDTLLMMLVVIIMVMLMISIQMDCLLAASDMLFMM